LGSDEDEDYEHGHVQKRATAMEVDAALLVSIVERWMECAKGQPSCLPSLLLAPR
jgi:hypothetical protein